MRLCDGVSLLACLSATAAFAVIMQLDELDMRKFGGRSYPIEVMMDDGVIRKVPKRYSDVRECPSPKMFKPSFQVLTFHQTILKVQLLRKVVLCCNGFVGCAARRHCELQLPTQINVQHER